MRVGSPDAYGSSRYAHVDLERATGSRIVVPGAHDIASMVSQSPLYWEAAQSRWYAGAQAPGRARLSQRPDEAGADERAPSTRLRPEAQSAAGLAGPTGALHADAEGGRHSPPGQRHGRRRHLVTILAGLRSELDRLEADLANNERIAERIQARTRYLLLSHRPARRLLRAHREWIDEVELERLPVPA